MNRLYILVAQEVGLIQCQDVGQSIGLHDRGKTSIMHLHAAHLLIGHQPSPNQIDFFVIWQVGHSTFNEFNALIGFRN